MEALTSELAYQSRRPPPGESSPPDTPDVTVHNETSTSDQTGESIDPSSNKMISVELKVKYS